MENKTVLNPGSVVDPFTDIDIAAPNNVNDGSESIKYQETERVENVMKFINPILDAMSTLSTDAQLKKERDVVEERLNEAKTQKAIGDLLAMAGNQAGASMSASANETIKSLQGVAGMIDANPESYKRYRAFGMLEQLGPQPLQGIYGLLAMTAKEKAPALNAFAQLLQANAYLMGGGQTNTEGSGFSIEELVNLLAATKGDKKTQKALYKILNNSLKDIIGD